MLKTVRKAITKEPLAYYKVALGELAKQPCVSDASIETPWITALTVSGTKFENRFRAVGALVAPQWVLAPAHAFTDAGKPRKFPKLADLELRAQIGSKLLGEGTLRKVDRWELNDHRKRPGRFPFNDFALVRLTEPVDEEPIRVDTASSMRIGDEVSAFGWPKGPHGDGILKQADTAIIIPQACAAAQISVGEVCAANIETNPMGPGYSGGPVVRFEGNDQSGKPVLRGLVSRGHKPTEGRVLPGVFTDVTAHLNFIEKTIPKNERAR